MLCFIISTSLYALVVYISKFLIRTHSRGSTGRPWLPTVRYEPSEWRNYQHSWETHGRPGEPTDPCDPEFLFSAFSRRSLPSCTIY